MQWLHGSRAKSASLPVWSEKSLQPSILESGQKDETVSQEQKTSHTWVKSRWYLQNVMQCNLIKWPVWGRGKEIQSGSQGCCWLRSKQAGEQVNKNFTKFSRVQMVHKDKEPGRQRCGLPRVAVPALLWGVPALWRHRPKQPCLTLDQGPSHTSTPSYPAIPTNSV